MTLRVSASGVSTGYRWFQRPVSTGWTSRQWLHWLAEQGVTPSVTPHEQGVCQRCFGPTGRTDDGSTWARCFDCQKVYRGVVDGVLPVCFSVQDGLEGAVWRAKHDGTQEWLRVPLASLLHAFLERHYRCVEQRHGQVDIVTVVPSHVSTRGGWDHLKRLHGSVRPWRQPWDLDLLVKLRDDRAESRRKAVTPDLFALGPGRDISGSCVLLVDDTYTSGGTLASAAYTLKSAGAATVAAVTLGRQLNRGHLDSQELLATLPGRGLAIETCGYHRH